MYVLIMDDNFPKCNDPPIQRVASVFLQAIASLDIPDHTLVLTGYLEYYGLAFEEEGTQVIVKEEGEQVLTVAFDEYNRLTNLAANIKPHRDT